MPGEDVLHDTAKLDHKAKVNQRLGFYTIDDFVFTGSANVQPMKAYTAE